MVADSVASAIALSLLLGAVALLIADGRGNGRLLSLSGPRPPPVDQAADAGHGNPRPHPSLGPLRVTPDILAAVSVLREVGCRTGNNGAVDHIERDCARFAVLAVRVIGRPSEDRHAASHKDIRATQEMSALMVSIVNAVQALYVSIQDPKMHPALDRASELLVAHLSEYVSAARTLAGVVGHRFPSPWSPDHDPAYDIAV